LTAPDDAADRDLRDIERAGVWRGGERVGTITRTGAGSVFAYDEGFLSRRPPDEDGIALRLPYAQCRFETTGVNLHPFFAGLLPEGLRLRAVVRLAKTSEDDLLSLLVAAGGDVVGDVAVGPGDVPAADATPTADVDRPEEVLFEDLLEESLRALGEPGRGWSVAGVQPKISAGRVSVPLRSRTGRRSWILKLGTSELPRAVENEAFFMAAARDCGLETPELRVVHDRAAHAGLLVARFDRVPAPRGAPPVRVHQEDACQVLDRYPADKYRLSLREVTEGIAGACTAPVLAAAHVLRLQAFSYAICNGDLHAKNVSVRRGPGHRRWGPTPAYDLISTLPYGDARMALGMEGRDLDLRRRDFVAFGGRVRVREAAVTALLDEVTQGLGPWIDRLEEIGLDARRTAHLRREMKRRLAQLRARR
jgi:serine/threonine-protein kinase HipA